MGVKQSEDVFILLLTLGISAVFYFLGQILDQQFEDYKNQFWIVNLLINLCSYSVIAVTGFLVFQYIKNTRYFEKSSGNCLAPLLRSCFVGQNGLPNLISEYEKSMPKISQNNAKYRKVRNKSRGLYFVFAIFSAAYIRGRLINEGGLY